MAEFNQHLAILYEVLASPIGLAVATQTPGTDKRLFEQARALDFALANISIRLSHTNPNAELWLINQTASPSKEPTP